MQRLRDWRPGYQVVGSTHSLRGIGMTSARTRERLIERLSNHGISDPEVLDRIRNVPRHLFIDEALASRAYEDSSLPIGKGQTISQPFVVALMTQALIVRDGKRIQLEKVLEIGTGCGYQTAVLSSFVRRIFSIERHGGLAKSARARLNELGYHNIRFRHGDGMKGWPGQAPFDGILVAAAPAEIPQILLDQLAPGGRLVIPVGGSASQQLISITRTDSEFVREVLCDVSFVPMLGGTG